MKKYQTGGESQVAYESCESLRVSERVRSQILSLSDGQRVDWQHVHTEKLFAGEKNAKSEQSD